MIRSLQKTIERLQYGTVVDSIEQRAARPLDCAYLDLREAAAILDEVRPEISGREGGVEADCQVSGVAATHCLCPVDNDLHLIKNPANTADKVATC